MVTDQTPIYVHKGQKVNLTGSDWERYIGESGIHEVTSPGLVNFRTSDGSEVFLAKIGEMGYASYFDENDDWTVEVVDYGNGGVIDSPEHDAVDHPQYYVLPNGAETIDITQWLSGAGAQAVQYIVRATRIDGIVKDKPVEDLRKAIYWLNIELNRLEDENG